MEKKIFILLIFAVLLAGCSSIIPISADPGNIGRDVNKIAVFGLPSGYRPEYSGSLAGYTVVSFTNGDGRSHLYLVQSDDQGDREKLAQIIVKIIPGANDTATRTTVLDKKQITLRNQPATLILSEGTNSVGELYRQASVAFEGKGGPALIVFSEPVDIWDLDKVNNLLDSFLE